MAPLLEKFHVPYKLVKQTNTCFKFPAVGGDTFATKLFLRLACSSVIGQKLPPPGTRSTQQKSLQIESGNGTARTLL
jgi:hypothetical protein